MTREDVIAKLQQHLDQLQQQFRLASSIQGKIPKLEMDRMLSDIRATYELFTVLSYVNTNPPPQPAAETKPAMEVPAEIVKEVPPEVAEPQPVISEPPVHIPKVETTQPVIPSPEPVAPAAEKPAEKLQPVPKDTLVNKFKSSRIEDLRKAVPLHEKFQYINELFSGDNQPYNSFLETINAQPSWQTAEKIVTETGTQRKWDPENKTFQKFIQLLQRRFQ